MSSPGDGVGAAGRPPDAALLCPVSCRPVLRHSPANRAVVGPVWRILSVRPDACLVSVSYLRQLARDPLRARGTASIVIGPSGTDEKEPAIMTRSRITPAHRQRCAVLNTLRTIALTEMVRAHVMRRARNSVPMVLDAVTSARVDLALKYLTRTAHAV